MLPVKSNLPPTLSRFFEDDWTNIFDWTNRNFKNINLTMPSVNVEENKDEFIIELAVPGYEKSDFKIELKNDVLIIKGESKKSEKVEEDAFFTNREFKYGSFQRSFNLNRSVVDDQKINASYQNGILRIELAKKEQAKEKPSLQINVK